MADKVIEGTNIKVGTELADVLGVETVPSNVTEIAPENRLAVIVKESGLEPAKANVMLSRFQDSFKMAAEWEAKAKMIVVTRPDQTADMAMARIGRLELKKKRTEIEATRKELKEQALREGKAIDGIANVLKALIVPIEDYLDKQERFVEIQVEEEKARQKILRVDELTKLNVDTTPFDLLNMPEEAYVRLRDGFKLEIENRAKEAARIEAERIAKEKADAERIAAAEAENKRLANEAVQRETEFAEERKRLEAIQAVEDRLASIERANAETERKRIEEESKKERERLDAEQKKKDAEAQKERERLETIAKQERDAKAALEAELEAKKKADEAAKQAEADKIAKAEKDRIAAEKKAQAAPDKEKIVAFAKQIEAFQMPTVKTAEAKKIVEDAKGLLTKVQMFLIQKSEAL